MSGAVWLAGIASGVLLAFLIVHVVLEHRWRRKAEARQRELLQGTERAIQGLGAELAGALAPVLRDSFEATLIPILAAMEGTLAELSRDVQGAQREALLELTQSFRDQLSSSFRHEFEELARTLGENAAWHERLHQDLGQILRSWERLGDGHTSLLRRTLKVSEAVRTNGESLARAERSLALAADRVQGTTAAITASMESTITRSADHLESTAERMGEKLTELAMTLNGQMEESSEQVTRRIRDISLVLQRVASQIDTLGREQRSRPGGTFPRAF